MKDENGKLPVGQMMEEFGPTLYKVWRMGKHSTFSSKKYLKALIKRQPVTAFNILLEFYIDEGRSSSNWWNLHEVIVALTEVWQFGRTKHEPRDWQKMTTTQAWDAVWRHQLGWGNGGCDDESGLHHVSHILFNLLVINWLEGRR